MLKKTILTILALSGIYQATATASISKIDEHNVIPQTPPGPLASTNTDIAKFDAIRTARGTVDHPGAEEVSFLAGHWLANPSPDETVELIWSPEYGASMIGTQRLWQSRELKSYQFLVIKEHRFGLSLGIREYDDKTQAELHSLPRSMGLNSYLPDEKAEFTGHDDKLGAVTLWYKRTSRDELHLSIQGADTSKELDFHRIDGNKDRLP